jgi:hypothetical protein
VLIAPSLELALLTPGLQMRFQNQNLSGFKIKTDRFQNQNRSGFKIKTDRFQNQNRSGFKIKTSDG